MIRSAIIGAAFLLVLPALRPVAATDGTIPPMPPAEPPVVVMPAQPPSPDKPVVDRLWLPVVLGVGRDG
jgi:hypothetical protein